jgi:hypothetical protein
LSITTYPLSIAIHPTDLLIVVAMSDANVIGIDPISGEKVCQFQTLAGIITKIIFHDGDVVIGTQAGFLMRWNLPNSLKIELAKEPNAPPIPFESEEEEEQREFDDQIRHSFIQQPELPPEWIYKEGRADLIPEQIEESPEEDEFEEKAPNPQMFDGPRPQPISEGREVEDFLRQSFVRRSTRKPNEEMMEIVEELRKVLEIVKEQLGIKSEDLDVIEAQRELKEVVDQMKPGLAEMDRTAKELALKMEESTRTMNQQIEESRARIAACLKTLNDSLL